MKGLIATSIHGLTHGGETVFLSLSIGCALLVIQGRLVIKILSLILVLKTLLFN